jgi:hypothetical protein
MKIKRPKVIFDRPFTFEEAVNEFPVVEAGLFKSPNGHLIMGAAFRDNFGTVRVLGKWEGIRVSARCLPLEWMEIVQAPEESELLKTA